MTTDIQPNCKCGRKLCAVTGGDSATFTARRTYLRCKTTWAVIVRPAFLKAKDGTRAYRVELTAL